MPKATGMRALELADHYPSSLGTCACGRPGRRQHPDQCSVVMILLVYCQCWGSHVDFLMQECDVIFV